MFFMGQPRSCSPACVCVCECVYCCARSKGLLISRYIHYKASAYCRTCGAGHCNRRGGPLRQLTPQREIERAKYDTHTPVWLAGNCFFFFAHLCCADRAASTVTTTEHGIGSVRPEIMAVHFLLEPSSPLRGFRFVSAVQWSCHPVRTTLTTMNCHAYNIDLQRE